jgi:hypothetical protein
MELGSFDPAVVFVFLLILIFLTVWLNTCGQLMLFDIQTNGIKLKPGLLLLLRC